MLQLVSKIYFSAIELPVQITVFMCMYVVVHQLLCSVLLLVVSKYSNYQLQNVVSVATEIAIEVTPLLVQEILSRSYKKLLLQVVVLSD